LFEIKHKTSRGALAKEILNIKKKKNGGREGMKMGLV